MKANVSPKTKKSLTYSAVILFILSVFLLGYFFYFLPKNRQIIHTNGFLILKTIAANIQAKSKGRGTLYYNFYKEAYKSFPRDSAARLTVLNGLLDENKIDATFKSFTAKEEKTVSQLNTNESGDKDVTTSFCIENENFVFSIKKIGRKDSLVFYEPVAEFLQPILVTQKDELFEYYALSKIAGKQSKLLYNDPDFGMRSDIPIDSLLPKNAMAYLNGIQNITSREFNHKMFYYPFIINGIQMQMYGFVRTDDYNSALRRVPFSFVYPLAIAFLILLFFLPILKFYIMDSNEQVKIIDVALFGLSVFMSASLVTLVIIQLLLWMGEEERVKENLRTLSGKISKSFISELHTIYNKLDDLDSARSRDSLSLATRIDEGRFDKIADYSDLLRARISAKTSNDTAHYYYFDRVSWIDTAGNQVIKAEMVGKPVFTNVAERKYFQVFKNNTPLVIYNDSGNTKKLGWEPIYSWTNGDFNISISKKSGEYIEAMATQMHSVVKTILPVGYGFCIIDGAGNVQVHSDVKRNLRENFFEKAEPSAGIEGVIAARQDTSVSDVVMYGKWHTMNFRPIPDLPYTLVTFYDKGALFPVNMRVLIFTLMFCVVFAVICTLLWLSLSRTHFKNHPLVYCPMDCLTWLTPQRKDTMYYQRGCIFLGVYTVVLIVFAALYDFYSISNYTIFSIVLLTPVNVVFVLLSLRVFYRWKTKEEQTAQPNKAATPLLKKVLYKAKFPAIHFTITAIYFLISASNDYPIGGAFIAFQVIFISWAWFDRLASEIPTVERSLNKLKHAFKKIVYKKDTRPNNTDDDVNDVEYKSYTRRFNLLVTLLIICLAVLPGALFTWYAYNQELIQTIKRQQLHLANDVEARSSEIMSRKGIKDNASIPEDYLNDVLYKKGIYNLDNIDHIHFNVDSNYDAKKKVFTRTEYKNDHTKKAYEEFYFAIAGSLSYPYYDPQNYPALKDHSSDRNWRWEKTNDTLHFWRYNTQQFPAAGHISQKALHITSLLPDHLRVLKWEWLWFSLSIGIFIIGLYIWLKSAINNIFLLKYVREKTVGGNAKSGLIAAYYKQATVEEKHVTLPGMYNLNLTTSVSHPPVQIEHKAEYYSAKGYEQYTTSIDRSKLNTYEKDILKLVRDGQGLYEYVWSSCSEKEKYLLFDFANDGLINYKNPREIFNLIHNSVFIVDDDYKLRLFSPGFRAFLLTKNEDVEIVEMRKKFQQNSTWQAIRGPMLLLLLGFSGVIFFTQEAVFQKFIALAGGVGTLISLIPKFLSVGGSKAAEVKEK